MQHLIDFDNISISPLHVSKEQQQEYTVPQLDSTSTNKVTDELQKGDTYNIVCFIVGKIRKILILTPLYQRCQMNM